MKTIYKISRLVFRFLYSLVFTNFQKKLFNKVGSKVKIEGQSKFDYINISIGNNVYIGPKAMFMSSNANIVIGNNVMFGPNVTIITGDHRYDLIGKNMIDVKENEKTSKNDQDVIIEDDVWIGANVTILKGVIIKKGSIIGACSVVTKSTSEYSINAGNPSKFIKFRFDEKSLNDHLNVMGKKK